MHAPSLQFVGAVVETRLIASVQLIASVRFICVRLDGARTVSTICAWGGRDGARSVCGGINATYVGEEYWKLLIGGAVGANNYSPLQNMRNSLVMR